MSTSHETTQIFSTILLPSEKLLWTGQPNPKEAAKRTTPLVLFGIVWTSMVSVILAMGVWGSISGKLGLFGILFALFALPFVFVGGLLLTSPFWTGKTARNTYYAITDKRAISVVAGKTPTVQAYNLSDLGAPYIVGGRNCPDLHWALQPVATQLNQSSPTTTSSTRGFNVTISQGRTTGSSSSSSNQSTRFEFTCLSDGQAAFDVANAQNKLLEDQRHKVDPLRLDQLKTMSSQGKLYVFSGLDMYEFDGTRVTNRKNLAKQTAYIVGPVVLCLATIFGLNFATNIINAKNGGIIGLIQPAFFMIFIIIVATNWARGGGLNAASTAMGATPVDFSNSKVIERLQTIYAAQGGNQTPERGIFSKLIGYLVLTVLVGGFGAMLLVPMWSSYQELQKALHQQPVVEKSVTERIEELRDQVDSAKAKVTKSTATKKVQQDNLNTLAYRRECLAAAQIEGSLPGDAADSYAEAIPERYQQLEVAPTKEAYDKVLLDVGRDAVWYADCLRDVKNLKKIDSIAPQLIAEIEKTSKAQHLDPLTEKQVLISKMTLAIKNAGYDEPQSETNAKLKQLQTSSQKERDAAYNKLISVLLDSMK